MLASLRSPSAACPTASVAHHTPRSGSVTTTTVPPSVTGSECHKTFALKFVLPLFLLPRSFSSPSSLSHLSSFLLLVKTKSKSRHAATARTTTVARLSASKAECNSAQMISSCAAASPSSAPFGNPSQVPRWGPFYKRTRGTCTLFALNFFRGIFCCPSANAAYAQQCLAALIFRSILLRAARFVLEQLKVGNEKLKTVLHKLTLPALLLPLSLFPLLSFSYFTHLLFSCLPAASTSRRTKRNTRPTAPRC